MDTFNSSIIPVLIDDIDTDQIIPARYLKSTSREGFGENLFRDWRFDKRNEQIREFALNNNKWSGQVLLAGKNFGCGSSREHAAWALTDFGFKAVVSTYFADIFKGNALNNGLLPIEVSDEFYNDLVDEIEIDPETKLTINLESQEVSLRVSGLKEKFEISPYKKECLLKGLDDLDYLIKLKNDLING